MLGQVTEHASSKSKHPLAWGSRHLAAGILTGVGTALAGWLWNSVPADRPAPNKAPTAAKIADFDQAIEKAMSGKGLVTFGEFAKQVKTEVTKQ